VSDRSDILVRDTPQSSVSRTSGLVTVQSWDLGRAPYELNLPHYTSRISSLFAAGSLSPTPFTHHSSFSSQIEQMSDQEA